MLNTRKIISPAAFFNRPMLRALCLPLVCWLLLWTHVAQSEATFATGKEAYQKGDFSEAEKIWLELAKKGDAQSQFFLGVLYDQGGETVAKDDKAASTWFEAAARQDHVNAQFNLGNAYKRGRGVPQSEEQAVFWWQQAADLGSPNAQFNLAIQYYQGLGIEKNWDKAVQYFNMAARGGHPKARELIDNKQVPLLAEGAQTPAADVAQKEGLEAIRNAAPASANEAATPAASSPAGHQAVSVATAPASSSPAAAPPAHTAPATIPDTGKPEQWLRDQKPGHYTIQLAASGSKEGVERFISQHSLSGQTVYFRGSKGGKALYYLLMGSFNDRHQANLHIESLPAKLRTNKPWARPFSDMQSLLDH